MNKGTYEALAMWHRGWWLVQVDQIGATQGRTLTEAHQMTCDMIAAMLEVNLSDVEVILRLAEETQR